jgi:two-component system phosphate regulon response regulator OmpR
MAPGGMAAQQNGPNTLADDAPHVLVVDDDVRIRDLLSRYLKENGYRVSQAGDGPAARASLDGLAFDLIVLDVMMPGETGFSIAQSLRENSDVPILMLTARSDPEDRIKGLEIGVDDYLAKPFEPRELLLRIQNIMRRKTPAADRDGEVSFGPFAFHLKRGELKRCGESVRLTDREREMMREFALNPGQTIAREHLAKVGGYENERAVDVQINRIRQKIESDPGNPRYLQTVRGRGYVLHTD